MAIAAILAVWELPELWQLSRLAERLRLLVASWRVSQEAIKKLDQPSMRHNKKSPSSTPIL
jgi:hypothetical protein